MILVTGAAGKTGQAVIKALVARGQAVRGFVRRPEQAAALEQLGVAETAAGDMTDQAAMIQAAKGAAGIYHICPNMHPQELSIGEKVILAARSAGAERFVYHSVLHPQIEAMPHHWQKMRVEELLFASGLPYTILQPAAYMQNVLANWDRIVGEGIYAVPYALETRMSLVDLQDVAGVAAKVLTEEGHVGAIYELCGPEILTQSAMAAIMSGFLGREVKGQVLPLDQWRRHARRAGLNDYAVDTLLNMFRYYDRHGFWGNGQVLDWLLGRSPTSFADFLARTIDERKAA